MTKTRNDKANQGGRQASKGNAKKRKGKFFKIGTLKDRHQRRLLPTKRCPLARNAKRLIEGNVNKEQTFVTFAARKGIMQKIAIRSGTRKAE